MAIDYGKGMRPNLYELMQGGGGGGGGYVLPPATADTLGGVIIGEGVDVEQDGTISVDVPSLDGYATEEFVADSVGTVERDVGIRLDGFVDSLNLLENQCSDLNEKIDSETEARIAEDNIFNTLINDVAYVVGEFVPKVSENPKWVYRITPVDNSGSSGDRFFEAWLSDTISIAITETSGNFYRSASQILSLPPEIAAYEGGTLYTADVTLGHAGYPVVGTFESSARDDDGNMAIRWYAVSGGTRNLTGNYRLFAYVTGIIYE